MLIHDRFIFLHVPKTGGMFLRDSLVGELPPGTFRDEREEPEVHAGRAQIPESLTYRPVLMYIRNPWDWYVSVYHFMMNPATARPPDPVSARISDYIFGGYANTFQQMVRAACHPGDLGCTALEREQLLREGSPAIRMLLEGCDFYTSVFSDMAGIGPGDDEGVEPSSTGPPTVIGRYETLVDDLLDFLSSREIVIADGDASRIRAARPINTSAHQHYRAYYDDDLRSEVGRSCEWIIDRFEYTF